MAGGSRWVIILRQVPDAVVTRRGVTRVWFHVHNLGAACPCVGDSFLIYGYNNALLIHVAAVRCGRWNSGPPKMFTS